MAVERARRFSFDLSELAPEEPEAPALRLVERPASSAPAWSAVVPAAQRPRWLGRLLPVFRVPDTLRVALVACAAPGFAEHLLTSLAGLLAAAGAEGGLQVLAWPDGLAVGCGGPAWVPEEASELLVAADLSAGSVRLALDACARPSSGRLRLVLNGDAPELDAVLGLDPARLPRGALLTRLPLLGPGELEPLARGRCAGLSGPGYGRPLAAFAAELVRRHLEAVA